MGRGKHLKTKMKEARLLAREAEKGARQGVAQFKRTQAGFQASLRDHLGRMIDRVDPFKSIAILGATVLIKGGMEWGEDVMMRWYTIFRGLIPFIGEAFFPLPLELPEVEGNILDSPQVEIIQWLLSFTLAYIVVTHFGEIIGGVGGAFGGIVGIASTFLTLA